MDLVRFLVQVSHTSFPVPGMAASWLAQPYIWNVPENDVTRSSEKHYDAYFSSNISFCVTKFHENLAFG
jgi:hypothetical protein